MLGFIKIEKTWIAVIALAAGLGLCSGPTQAAAAGTSPVDGARGRAKTPLDVQTWVSGCLGDPIEPMGAKQAPLHDCDGISLFTRPSAIVMYHAAAILNCCTDVSVAVEVDGTTVRFLEQESGEYCPCLCEYDLSAQVEGLEAGLYQVEVISSTGELLCSRTVEVFGFCGGVSFSSSGCLKQPKGALHAPEESVDISVHGSSIHVDHRNASLNCCLELVVEVVEAPGAFRVVEVDHGEPCNCLCPFDIHAVILGVAPGRYEVEVVSVYGVVIATANVRVPIVDQGRVAIR